MNAGSDIAQDSFGLKDHHEGSSQFRDVFQHPDEGSDDDDDDNVEEAEPQPVCSVLNTVIDYVMVPPTPLEQDEYLESQQGQDGDEVAGNFDTSSLLPNRERKGADSPPLLVPVLRVFGPIIRRDTTMSESILPNPTQSACLYIHNAFPYMLARPKLAGPDGSLHHQLQEQLPGQVDWDSVESVERILPVLHETLEATIQSSFQDFAASNNNNNNNNSSVSATKTTTTTSSSNTRVIRKITVVCGRGFYTFCPGPPAPFLRVEYYNPSQRWKVKRVLERGLPDLPECYHPVQRNSGEDLVEHQQQAQLQPQRSEGPPPPDVLQFCCYEAHIPFTMQFFKDHNLAGMSYIHLSLHGIHNKNKKTQGIPTLRFRKSLPQKDRPKTLQQQQTITLRVEQDRNDDQHNDNNHYLFLESNTPDEYRWETVEFVESSSFSARTTSQVSKTGLNNTSSDTHPALQQSSLSESSSDHVAQQLHQQRQRQRNTTQSPPWTRKETSCDVELDVSVENILNVLHVIKELPQKDSRDSIHWRAVPSLYEIWQEERRRMAKLVPPKDDFLSAATAVAVTTPPSLTLNVKKNAPKPGSRLALEGMQALLRVSPGLEQSFRRSIQQIVQRHERAIDRVDQMLLRKNRMTEMIHSTPSHDETVQALGALETLFDESCSPQKEEKAPFIQSQDSALILSSSVGSQNSSQKELLQALSQSYYDLKERPVIDETEDGEFELSQRIDRGEGIVTDGAFESIDEFIDPETLTPYENIEDDDDDDEMDEKGMEQMLSVLATQTLEASQKGSPYNAYDDASSVESIDLLAGKHEVFRNSTPPANLENNDDEGVTGDPMDDLSISDTLPPGLTRSIQKEQEVQIGVKLGNLGGLHVTPRATPPTRGEMSNPESVNGLLPMSSNGEVPSVISHLVTLEKGKGISNDGSRWLPQQHNKNRVTVCLTRLPPTRKTVCSWHRKQKKRMRFRCKDQTANKRLKVKEAATELELDGNSRKLVVSAVREEIEEVEWDASQPNVQTQTQATQDENEMAALEVTELSHDEQKNHENPPACLKKSSSQSIVSPPQGAALEGLGNQGGRLWIAGGGELKAKTRPSQFRNAGSQATLSQKQYLPTPVSVMVLEIHVQCRTGRAGVSDSKMIAMTPDSSRDKVSAVMYLFGRDPGGGENLETIERGCIFVPVSREVDESSQSSVYSDLAACVQRGMPRQVLGVSAPLSVECVRDERQLLLRLASIVRWKDPDMLLSWDTQGSGLGYLIERGVALGKDESIERDSGVGNNTAKVVSGVDLARLLSRTPRDTSQKRERRKSALESAFGEVEQTEGTRNESGLSKEKDRWVGSGLGSDWDERVGAGTAAASISGRVVFAAWKIVAEEVKHPNASYLPAVVSSVLNQRIPYHDNLTLSEWYGHDRGKERWRVFHYKFVQATSCLLLFDALDVIGRSGEAARLSGVEFSQSFPGIRGSQYKVEGVLLRALQSLNSSERGSKRGSKARLSETTKSASLSDESRTQSQSPWKARRRGTSVQQERTDDETKAIHELSNRSYFFYSPSLQDTNEQEALEVQALTLEPESGCYSDPVVVCDFTALYPSLVIAYNLCYSTISGRLDYHSTREEMRLEGRTTGKIGPFLYSEDRSAAVFKHHFRSFRDDKWDRAYAAPTGTVYVSESVLKGVLPQVLDEILSTRAMLKKASKLYKRLVPDLHSSILRQLEARQLALKYVANVTYGYTSATFSGRCAMPLLADTIVECGRRTLTNAINLANSWGSNEQNKWHGCKVIYGDTDSVFIKLPGRSVQEAFQFGEEFCKAVTASNPPPVQLKLEKVYLGSIMQTKKKYCGMKFESKDQRKPVFEAKGLETIRRDQCALTQKVLRNCLVTLFRSGIQAVKAYLYNQWRLILSGQLPVSDFILTGRVRSRYRGGKVGPVQAVLARRLAEADPGRVVRHKERIAYCIVATPGLTFRLRDCVLTPMELLEQWDAYTIHAGYYIAKHVNAALQRCLGLPPHNIDVNSWYETCPKPSRRIHFWPVTRPGNSIMISSFFGSDVCSLCKSKCMAPGFSRAAVCSTCRKDPVAASQQALVKLSSIQKESAQVAERCKECNQCFEDGGTFAQCRWIQQQNGNVSLNTNVSQKLYSSGIVTPLANCTCIDCPVTYERHRLKEMELEAIALCEALGII